MATALINLDSSEVPTVDIMRCDNGEQFMNIVMGSVSVSMPGYDAVSVAAARTLGTALLVAAAKVEATMQPRPQEPATVISPPLARPITVDSPF